MDAFRSIAVAAVAVALGSVANATPYPSESTPAAIDLGEAASAASPITVTVELKLRNEDQAQTLLHDLYTPGSAQFGKFITSQQFAEQFGPSAQTVAQITQHFEGAGLAVSRSSTTQLTVTGSAAAIAGAFGVQLHNYQVPAAGRQHAYNFRAPTGAPQLSADIADAVQGVLGLDTRPRFRPHLQRHAGPVQPAPAALADKTSSVPDTTDAPGLWTVIDFGQYYNVDPLYQRGISGKNRSIGIITLAAFTPSDAYGYWSALGLKVSSTRLKTVLIDGGAGAPSDDSGSEETTLDVEQSGGIAPSANLIVYVAPNTDQGFIDAFARAIDSNAVDTLSTSWGEWEYLDAVQNPYSPPNVTDPANGRTTTELKAFNDLLTQAALQGQSAFAAAGDSGAYDANDPQLYFPLPGFSQVLSVDDPASQPYITAAGGTTLPGPQQFPLPSGKTLTINVATERAWSWDYLDPLCAKLGLDPVSCGIFPVGGGGGVSSYFALPSYQYGIPGITSTAPGQVLIDYTQKRPQTLVRLPSGYYGRNVPDLSVNADPDTGYVIYYTSDQVGFIIDQFIGGTSFSSPQLNGVTALLDQGVGHRLGLLNFALYNLVRFHQAYNGRNAPLRDIVTGDNDFYNATPGYDQATGVGVPNVANLLQALE
jgi:kumamolisin